MALQGRLVLRELRVPDQRELPEQPGELVLPALRVLLEVELPEPQELPARTERREEPAPQARAGLRVQPEQLEREVTGLQEPQARPAHKATLARLEQLVERVALERRALRGQPARQAQQAQRDSREQTRRFQGRPVLPELLVTREVKVPPEERVLLV